MVGEIVLETGIEKEGGKFVRLAGFAGEHKRPLPDFYQTEADNKGSGVDAQTKEARKEASRTLQRLQAEMADNPLMASAGPLFIIHFFAEKS